MRTFIIMNKSFKIIYICLLNCCFIKKNKHAFTWRISKSTFSEGIFHIVKWSLSLCVLPDFRFAPTLLSVFRRTICLLQLYHALFSPLCSFLTLLFLYFSKLSYFLSLILFLACSIFLFRAELCKLVGSVHECPDEKVCEVIKNHRIKKKNYSKFYFAV